MYYKELGTVRMRHVKPKICHIGEDKGYYIFNTKMRICDKFIIFRGRINRIVAMAFIDNPENKSIVDHISTNTYDNRVENLRWATPKENSNNENTIKKLKKTLSKIKRKDVVGIKHPYYDCGSETDCIDDYELNSERFLSTVSFCGEIWKDQIYVDKKYSVSNLGRVKSYNFNEENCGYILTQKINKGGYLDVSTPRGITKLVHRLVLQAFNPTDDENLLVDHIDTNKKNNKLSNLRWSTHKDNSNNELSRKKISDSQKDIIHKSNCVAQYSFGGEFIKVYSSAQEAADSLNINVNCIRSACNGSKNATTEYMWRYCDSLESYEKQIEHYIDNSVAVNQYDMDGHYIKTYRQLSEPAKEFGVLNENIWAVCVNYNHCVSVKGYQYRYEHEYPEHNDIEPLEKPRIINQYDLNGKFLKQYSSITDVHKAFSKKIQLSRCCTGRDKSAQGFQWRYAKDENDISDISPITKPQHEKNIVNEYDLSGHFIRQFESIKKAIEITGCLNMGRLCKEQYTQFKTYKGHMYRIVTDANNHDDIEPYVKVIRNHNMKEPITIKY